MTPITNQPTAERAENELLKYLQGERQQDFSKLYDRYAGAIYGLLITWIRDGETAENLLQDVFVKAWRNRHLYDPSKGRLFTWLYNIARNISIDYLRSRTFKKAKAAVLAEDVSLVVPARNAVVKHSQDTIGLRKLLDTLSRDEKEVLELMYFKGYTQREIAGILDAPLGTVKTRMSRAIRNLRSFYNRDWDEARAQVSMN